MDAEFYADMAFQRYFHEDFQMTKPIKVAGKLYFTQWMSQLNKRFDEDNIRYECFVGNLTKEAQNKLLHDLGIHPKTHKDENIGNFFVAKTQFLFDDKVVDTEGKKIDPKRLGYGTEVIAVVESYKTKQTPKFGMSPSIKMLIVTKLVPYEAAERMEQGVEFDHVL